MYEEVDDSDYGYESIKMTLTFNSDNTGKIVEDWEWTSRAESKEKYSMEFSWSITTDSNGNNTLRVSYISGDKDTEIFYGNDNTVLWTRQYVLTGKILNIYGNGLVL